MRYAVTGASGFLGSTLVRRLVSAGDTVHALVNRRPAPAPDSSLKVFQADLRSAESRGVLDRFLEGADAVFHCAAEISEENEMIDSNVNGTSRLIEAARGRVRHWVQVSSVDVYGTQRDGAVSEETAPAPMNRYEETKAAADRLVMDASERGYFPHTIVRPSKIYGEGMRTPTLFQLFKFVDRGIFFYVGPPGAAANYVHVDDVAEAMVACAREPAARGRTYNVSDYCALENLIAVIAEALGKPAPTLRLNEDLVRLAARVIGGIPGYPLTTKRIDGMTKRARYPSTRIAEELNFRFNTPMRVGIPRLVRRWAESR